MKDLVKAADGNIEGLKHLLKTEWELPEDTRVAVYGIDCDGVEFEFTPMVAHDLLGMQHVLPSKCPEMRPTCCFVLSDMQCPGGMLHAVLHAPLP